MPEFVSTLWTGGSAARMGGIRSLDVDVDALAELQVIQDLSQVG